MRHVMNVWMMLVRFFFRDKNMSLKQRKGQKKNEFKPDLGEEKREDYREDVFTVIFAMQCLSNSKLATLSKTIA